MNIISTPEICRTYSRNSSQHGDGHHGDRSEMTDEEFLAGNFENTSQELSRNNATEDHGLRPDSDRPYLDPVSRRWICPDPHLDPHHDLLHDPHHDPHPDPHPLPTHPIHRTASSSPENQHQTDSPDLVNNGGQVEVSRFILKLFQ